MRSKFVKLEEHASKHAFPQHWLFWQSRQLPKTALSTLKCLILSCNFSVRLVSNLLEKNGLILKLISANTLVQRFLSMISSGIYQYNVNRDTENLLVPFALMKKVPSLLVNSSVTEINCRAFADNSTNKNIHNFLLQHALKNCPVLSKIELRCERKLTSLTIREPEFLPVERFKNSWADLKSIKSRNEYICSVDTLKYIQENFPNIESVIFTNK
jgi:N-acetylglutamate synthase-like GNAT family acetyltransferase